MAEATSVIDIVIVGSGPAGLTAALYALRANKRVLLLEKSGFGGQIATSPKVENIPGTAQISGAAYADSLLEQVLALGAEVELEQVTAVAPQGGTIDIKTEEGSVYTAKAVVLATGVKHRMLGVAGEEELVGSGISYCAVCDGAFYAGQRVAVIGGGNSALQEAFLLSDLCESVTVVQNLANFTGEPRLVDALLTRGNVHTLFSTTVSGFATENGELTALQLQNETTGTAQTLPVDGVFVSIGLLPENEVFADVADLTPMGYFAAEEACTTKTPGVFVAGDCRAKRVRQVTTACADGAVAALAACAYIDGRE